jgi:hypothetical protein
MMISVIQEEPVNKFISSEQVNTLVMQLGQEAMSKKHTLSMNTKQKPFNHILQKMNPKKHTTS